MEGAHVGVASPAGAAATAIAAAATPNAATPHIRPRATLTGHTEAVTAVRFSPDAQFLASASGDRTIKIWSVATSKLLATFGEDPTTGHKLGISDVAWSHDGALLASCSDDRSVKIWDRATGTMKHSLAGHSNFVLSVDFHPRKHDVVSGSYDTKVLQWDAEKGRLTKIIANKHKSPVSSVRYNPDGQYILSTSYDGVCNIFNAATGDVTLQVVAGDQPIICGSWAGLQSKFVLLAFLNSTVQLWSFDISNTDSKAAKCLRQFKGHQNHKYAVFSFAPVKAMVVLSASEDGSLYCWNIQRPSVSSKVSAHKGVVLGLDARGTVIATSGLEDNSIKLWELGGA